MPDRHLGATCQPCLNVRAIAGLEAAEILIPQQKNLPRHERRLDLLLMPMIGGVAPSSPGFCGSNACRKVSIRTCVRSGGAVPAHPPSAERRHHA